MSVGVVAAAVAVVVVAVISGVFYSLQGHNVDF